jgi:geranylgeranyl pyrophosphate synthase
MLVIVPLVSKLAAFCGISSSGYSLLAGGKRVRPILALASAEAVSDRAGLHGDARERALADALPVACAIEFIHTYSLVHDDLPPMDIDSLRGGRPTAHVVYGDGLAILAGDGLLTEAFALMAREPAGHDPDLAARKLRALGVVAAAAGAAGMVGGQAIDLEAAGQVRGAPGGAGPLDDMQLRRMDAMKTGALIRSAAVAGAIMARGSDADIEAIDRFAAPLGLAFQIVDDILDVEGTTGELGKTAGKDEAAGKPTYVSLHGVAGARRLARASIEEARSVLTAVGLAPSRLEQIAEWVVARTC